MMQKLVLRESDRANVRVYDRDKDRFNEMRKPLGKSQHEFFQQLLNHWEQTQLQPEQTPN